MSEEGGGHSVGLWYVSFSDMITLLLSFFVMLATFSSFDKEGQEKLRGVMRCVASYGSIFPDRGPLADSYVPPVEGRLDWTDLGSEMPTDEEPGVTIHPRQVPWHAQTGAYQSRKTFRIPSGRLFWARGSSLTPEGRQALALVVQFLRQVPCRVIVAEAGGGDPAGELALERAWTVRSYLAEAGLPQDSLCIASRPAGKDSPAAPAIEIALEGRSPKP